MGRLNIQETIEKGLCTISSNYSLDMGGVEELLEISKDSVNLLNNSFAIGYIQGVKAAKAEMKKKGVAV